MHEGSDLYSEFEREQLERGRRSAARRPLSSGSTSQPAAAKPRKRQPRPRRYPRPWPWPYPVGWGGSFVGVSSVDQPTIYPAPGEPSLRSPSEPIDQPSLGLTAECRPSVVLDGFEKGDYRLRLHHYELLDRFISSLSGLASRFGSHLVKIVGHTDRIGTAKTNEGLSFSRALEVERYLTSMLGDIPTKVSAFGASRPIASSSTEAGRRRNRRVELMLCPRGTRLGRPARLDRESVFASEMDELCREAGQLAARLREALARARGTGASRQELKRIQDAGFRWVADRIRAWRPRVRSLSNRDLDRLIGCLARVSSGLGVDPRRLRAFRISIGRRLGAPI